MINIKILSRTRSDSPPIGPQQQRNKIVVKIRLKAASQTEAASRVLTGKALHRPTTKCPKEIPSEEEKRQRHD